MRIERIEARVTDLKARLTRMRSTGSYDTGAAGALLGKPILVTIFAEGVEGHGQIRPLAPHHSLADTYASMLTTIIEVCGPRMIGRSIFDLEAIHALFDQLTPANFAARAALDIALHDAAGKALNQPVYNLIGGLSQKTVPLEWSISMADDVGKMVDDAQTAVGKWGIGGPPPMELFDAWDAWAGQGEYFLTLDGKRVILPRGCKLKVTGRSASCV